MTREDHRTPQLLLILTLAIGFAACRRTIDLDDLPTNGAGGMQGGAGGGGGSGEAPFIWERAEFPFSIVADATRVYWSTVNVSPSGFTPPPDEAVRSCAQADCANTVKTYSSTPWTQVSSGTSPQPRLALDGDNLYWLDRDRTLMTCPVVGCNPAPRVVAHLAASEFVADEHYVYSPNATEVVRCALPDCTTSETVARVASAHTVTVHRGDVYFAATDAGRGRIYRAPKDGANPPTVIAEQWAETESIAVSSDHVYWSFDQGAGAILRCPLSGCTSDPETFVDDEHPRNLLASASELFWASTVLPVVLWSDPTFRACSLTGCDPAPTRLVGARQYGWSMQSMAMEGAHLFIAEQGDCPDPSCLGAPTIRRLTR
jgi:hypothetical protein